MANAGEKRKISIEPITAVCAVVLLIACVAVVAVDVEAKFFTTYENPVGYGDSVTVDYTGSLNTYYDRSNDSKQAVIFDTSVESVGKNSDYIFTDSFSKSSYSPSTIVLGNGKFLEKFETALMGKNVGETVRVKIAAADAYPAADNSHYATEFSFANNIRMSASDFTTKYKETAVEGAPLYFEDDNEMSLRAVRNGNDVTVTYLVAVDDTFTLVDSALGKVVMTVTATDDNKVTYTLALSNTKAAPNVTADGHTVPGVEMITVDCLPGTHMAILGADASGIVYKGTDSTDGKDSTIYNQDLYFVIKIVSKN